MFNRIAFTAAAVLFLAACNASWKDISVAEYESHMWKQSFSAIASRYRHGGGDVRIIGKSNERERRLIAETVAVMNAALPSCAQLTMKPPMETLSFKQYIKGDRKFPPHIAREKGIPNTVHIEFIGVLKGYPDHTAGWSSTDGGYIAIKKNFDGYDVDKSFKILLLHELMHSMGIRGHVPLHTRSIMSYSTAIYASDFDKELPKSDKAVLAHLYPC